MARRSPLIYEPFRTITFEPDAMNSPPLGDVNRAREMEVFARVVDASGFSAAARDLRLSPSAVSKLVSRLEARIGARLLNRTTRKLVLTPEGAAFHEQARRILADLDEAERAAAAGAAPRGRVRVSATVAFGLHCLVPLIPGFTARYPEIIVDLDLTDAVIDLMDQRADVAIRVGKLSGGSLMARKLGSSRTVALASPAWLARHGTPRDLTELAGHNLISFNFVRQRTDWPFLNPDGSVSGFPARGNVTAGDGETARALALADAGIVRLARYHVEADIAAGRLVPILEAFDPGDAEDLHAVYVGGRATLPSRVRAFIDYLVETVRLEA
jgi:DNA-binding transcriptional LysR family regulator